jgi:NDP-hexose 4-ketoreductase
MMRVMIIGATGFLGAHVRVQARAVGLEVVTAGRSRPADSDRHLQLDLAADDPGRVAGLLTAAAPDVVVNCAGATTGGTDVLSAVNVTGPYALAAAMLQAGLSARLVHLGSAAEYGPGEPGVAVAEYSQPRPASPYGATKLAGTRIVQLARAAGLDAVVLRVFNPVGPGSPENSLPGRLAAQLRQAVADGTDVRLGPLDAVRDFVDARDVADAVVAAATAVALPNPVLNIGSGLGLPVRTLVKELVAISGRPVTVHEGAAASVRSADTSWQQAEITCALHDLSWRPRREIGTSLLDLWEETT